MNPLMRATPPRLLTRCLLRPDDIRPEFDGFEVIGVFNPAAIAWDGRTVLLVRVAERPAEVREGFLGLPYWDMHQSRPAVDWRGLDELDILDPRIVRIRRTGQIRLTFLSRLLVAFSGDGLSIDGFGEASFLPANRYETLGVEDPRLVRFGDRFYFTYVAVSEFGIVTSLASTVDFRSFERHGILFCPEDKDVVIFPEKIGGQYVALHRPNPHTYFAPPEIWMARSPDLLHWGAHQRILGFEAGWAALKIGGGTPPIRTRAGWLSLFHGQMTSERPDEVGPYAAAAMLQDFDDPSRVIGISPRPIMTAEHDFERTGFLSDVVFPTGLVSRGEAGEEVDVYYGAADTSTAVARFAICDVLDAIEAL